MTDTNCATELQAKIAASAKESFTKAYISMMDSYDEQIANGDFDNLSPQEFRNRSNKINYRFFDPAFAYNLYFMDQRFDRETREFTVYARRATPELIERSAEAYSQRIAKTWVAKFEAKIGACENPVLDYYNTNGTFLIKAEWAGKPVRLEQNIILKFSNHGRPFNQWPSRIYVDGQFTPEAKFKKMQKEAA